MLSTKVRKKSTGKMRSIQLFTAILVLVIALIIGTIASKGYAGGELPFDVAEIYFELNNTDGDLGIHALIDGEPWKRLEIEDKRDNEMLEISVKGRLRQQGLTELFFESAEPSFDELDPEDFFDRFPEGWYEIEGITLEGDELESKAWLSHVMPAPPDGIVVSGIPIDPDAVDCDEAPPVVEAEEDGSVIISWDAVTTSHPEIGKNGGIQVVKYELVVEEEDSELVFSVDLPPEVTEMAIPAGFLELGEEFKFEILVRERSFNQTAVESCFEVE